MINGSHHENERIQCPFCQSLDIRGKMTALCGGRISICNHCGLGFDQRKRMVDYENSTTFAIDDKQLSLYHRYARRLMPIFNGLIEKNLSIEPTRKVDILEIGPGYGLTSDYLTHKLPVDKYYHYELNVNLKQWLQRHNKLVLNSLDEIDKVDIIIMSHVLEHIPDAGEYLSRLLRDKVRKNGYILLAQTDHSGFIPTYLPFLWYGWQLKQHYYHFTPGTFHYLSRERRIFDVVGVEKYYLDQDAGFSLKGAVKLFLKIINYMVPMSRYDAFMIGIRNGSLPGQCGDEEVMFENPDPRH